MLDVSPALEKWIDEYAALRGRAFGRLEHRVMAALWTHGPMSIRDIRRYFPRLAYTTLLTTLDRLYKKGLLARSRVGQRDVYRAALSRVELQTAIVDKLFRDSGL